MVRPRCRRRLRRRAQALCVLPRDKQFVVRDGDVAIRRRDVVRRMPRHGSYAMKTSRTVNSLSDAAAVHAAFALAPVEKKSASEEAAQASR